MRATDVRAVARSIAAFGLQSAAGTWPAAPLPDDTWHTLLHVVRSQRLAGLLVAAIDGGSLPATDRQRAQAGQEHVDWVCRVLAIEQGAVGVITHLTAAGVRVRLLKGAASARLDYPDPALRLFVDVDLLVPSADFDEAVAALTAAGHRRRHQQPRPGFDRRFSKGTSFYSPEGLAVDLHRTFVMGPFGLRVDLDDLWGPGSPVSLGATSVEALDPEARFLHACFHTALGDVVPRLVPQRDTAQMLLGTRPLDLSRVDRLMRRWQAEPVVATAVAHTWRTLRLADRSPLAEWALRYRPSPRAVRDLALYSDPDSSYARTSLGALRAVRGVRNKAAFAYALAFPQGSYVQGRYAGPWERWRSALRAVRDSDRRTTEQA